ncbi:MULTISPECIES: M48 family metalloprotease [Methylocystis]|uniref:Metalloprotease n=1 Tax=Methylocystis iwaonis TaxID=2885079 RepID=A0ABM8E9Y8_9HYPH|nr:MULTISPECIES: M48 family metalloprotease [Methylocystis]MBL1256524.1 M48 family metalloprotease [Methylocystis sp. Sn-Cys]BDV34677.1 metalloprotease [Methylocystis iwaonis]
MTRRRDLLRRAALAVACAVALANCAELERQGQLFGPTPTPPTRPALSKTDNRSSVQHKELLAQFGGEYQAVAAEHYLNDILVKLAQASETPGQTAYKVTILNTPVVNAFALPSGNLYVTRGLLALAGDASEAAAVMAHEIGHVTLRHSALRAEKEREAALISQAATVIQSRQKGEEERSKQRLSVASFSRQQEIDADETGVRVIARAGFDPYGAARFLTALGRSSELRAALYGKRKDSGFDITSTHPSTPERVTRAITVARQIGAPGIGNRDRAGYLAAINGVAFGDDPMEGFVRDRKFTHPRLRFAFAAPEGFLLENSSEAVFGVRQADNEALRLDTVRNPPSESLEAYVASGWVDGLLPSSVRKIDVNGLPAVTAVARAGEWNFRLAVIQSGEYLYRLIFAARALTDQAEKEFMDSIATFRRITPEEAREAHGLKLSIVTAGTADTAESLAARMTTPNRPLEYFRLLNGLDESEPVVAGERYKIVTE